MRQVHAAYVIAKKDAAIYYLKPPVLSFGIIFPVFFFLAFAAGRDVSIAAMVPGIVAMALFFTASVRRPAGHALGAPGQDLGAAGDLAGLALGNRRGAPAIFRRCSTWRRCWPSRLSSWS